MLGRMFRFVGKTEAPVETQRAAFDRILGELNDAIAGLPEKPRIVLEPNSGVLGLELPAQLPDEMPALPAPEKQAA